MLADPQQLRRSLDAVDQDRRPRIVADLEFIDADARKPGDDANNADALGCPRAADPSLGHKWRLPGLGRNTGSANAPVGDQGTVTRPYATRRRRPGPIGREPR